MAEQAYAYVTLVPVAKGFQSAVAKQLQGVGGAGGSAGRELGGGLKGGLVNSLKGLAGPIIAAIGVQQIGQAFANAIGSASAFTAEFEGVKQTFGTAAASVQAFADTAAQTVGLAETEALRAAKAFGGFASAAGLSGQSAADFSIDLVKAAGDLASFADVPVTDALDALQSGLAGQSEPLRRFQIFVDDTTLKAYAMDKNLGDAYETMTQGEKTVLRQAAIMEQLGVKQGDFVNYADTFGNAVKTIQGTFADLTTEIGLALLPSLETLAVQFRDTLIEMSDDTTPLGDSFVTLRATIELFGEKFAEVFSSIETSGALQFVLESITNMIIGFMEITFFAAEAGQAVAELFDADPNNSFERITSFMTRYNAFVDDIYKGIDGIAKRLKAIPGTPMLNTNTLEGILAASGTITSGKKQPKAEGGPSGPTPAELRAQMKGYIEETQKDLIENRKRFNKVVKEARQNFAETLVDIGKDYDKAVDKANMAYSDRAKEITKRYNESVAEATKQRDASLAESLRNHSQAMADINDDYAKRLTDINQQSMNRLRDAFRSAVSVNVASIFDSDAIAGSIDGTVETLREKLMDSRQLIANAAALSAAGFSQTFIEQVVGAGTEVGNEMATAILNSSPEQQREMQALFGEIETTASHGMDSLAQSLLEKNGLATEELRNLYAATEAELASSLARQTAAYDAEVLRIETEFMESMATAKELMDQAMIENQEALDQALLDAKVSRDEALADAEETLQKALLAAHQNFLEDIERIEKAFNEKVRSMKGQVSSLASEISGLQSQINSAQAAASRAAAATAATVGKITGTKIALAEGGLVTGPTNALIGEAGPELVIPLDRFESMMGMAQGGAAVNYYAAPNQSLDSEQELFQAMQRAKVVVGW